MATCYLLNPADNTSVAVFVKSKKIYVWSIFCELTQYLFTS